jgi:hypothetical protein
MISPGVRVLGSGFSPARILRSRSTPSLPMRAGSRRTVAAASPSLMALRATERAPSSRLAVMVFCVRSAAWIRLKVEGVTSRSRLPRELVRCTSGDEFHSVNTARWPSLRSRLCSRSSCVPFPEPSIPSTTSSLPGSGIPSGNVAIGAFYLVPRLREVSLSLP